MPGLLSLKQDSVPLPDWVPSMGQADEADARHPLASCLVGKDTAVKPKGL